MQSVLRSLYVLEGVAEHQPVGVGELSRLLDLPKSTVQRNLTTLAQAGWARVDGREVTRWVLTARALTIGQRTSREVSLRDAALGPMQKLRDDTNETIHLAVPDGLRCMVLIERIDCSQAVRTFHHLGAQTPLQATSTGRSVLANLPANQAEQVIAQGLERYSECTITDPEKLRGELHRIRRRGYALNMRQYRSNVCAVGAAILDKSGYPVAGICISMPDSRYNRRHLTHWGELVTNTATDISANGSLN